jgi:hypothetical protein
LATSLAGTLADLSKKALRMASETGTVTIASNAAMTDRL